MVRHFRRIARHLLNKLLSRIGLTIIDRREVAQSRAVRQVLERFVVDERLSQRPAAQRGGLPEGVIFSKDRPLQLHALLSSYFDQVTHPAPLHVLYRISDMHYDTAYRELAQLFARRPVTFVREESFSGNVREVIGKISAPTLFFLVDDIVVVEPFDMKDFANVDTDRFVPSLRLGGQLTYCYTMHKEQSLPPFVPHTEVSEGKLVWHWAEGAYDWGYPLSVDGHLFSTYEMQAIVDTIQFSGPNSLETHLQRFSGIFLPRFGVCYEKSRIVNIPLNKVQTEERNRSMNVDTASLLHQWNKGLQIDFKALYGCANFSVHQELPLTFVPRTSS